MTVGNKMIKRESIKDKFKQKNKPQKKLPVTVILGDSLVNQEFYRQIYKFINLCIFIIYKFHS